MKKRTVAGFQRGSKTGRGRSDGVPCDTLTGEKLTLVDWEHGERMVLCHNTRSALRNKSYAKERIRIST